MQSETESLPPLSSAGLQRREAILSLAKRHASRRRRRQHLSRAGAAILVAAGLGSVLWMSRPEPSLQTPLSAVVAPEPTRLPQPPPSNVAQEPAPHLTPPASPYAQFNFATIQTSESAIDAYALRVTSAASVSRMNDEQLLESLHRAGVDAGIAQVGQHSTLVLNDTFRSHTP